jgi:FkbM family methyltransferase
VKLLQTLMRAVPLLAYAPFRNGVVTLRRGSLARKACVAVLKLAAGSWRGHLARRVSEIRPLDMPQLVFRSVDSMVLDAVYWFGVQGYEGRVADVWVALCRRARAVLEVGGNVGLFTVIGAHASTARYTVVEPVPAIAAVLQENLRRNGLARVELLQAAAIPESVAREVILHIPDEGRGVPVGSHLTEGVEVTARASAGSVRVAGYPFRDLLAGRDLIKIDAEGIEARLLESARDTILAERPTLLIEILPSATRLAALIAELAQEVGYSIHILPEWGSDTIVTVAANTFTAALPARFHSKDVVLSAAPLPV